MKKILIIGGASAIAKETATHFAREGAEIYLVDLTKERAEAASLDINVRAEAKIIPAELNVLDFDRHEQVFAAAAAALKGLDLVFIAHGTLPDPEKTHDDPAAIRREFEINALSVMSLATIAAKYFEEKKSGTIAVISSVAGDRGRKSNYVYGAAKGAVTTFLQGLRNRLSSSGVNVLTIKPGQVATPMTAHMPESPLLADPKDIGKLIYKAIVAEKDIVYVPGYWGLVMTVIKAIPEAIFKKLDL